jgi:hypothetical protein
MNTRIVILLSFLFSSFFAAGCGKGNQIIQDVRARTYTSEQGEERLELVTVWSSGSVQIPTITLPVLNPKHWDQNFGSITVQPMFPSGLSVGVDLNFAEIAKIDGDDATLPNQTAVPINGATVIGFPVKDSGAKVYVGLSDEVAVLGFAVPIQEFDKIGQKTGKANFFLPFSFPYIKGTGGLYAGPESNESGVALFVDVGDALGKVRSKSVELAVAQKAGRFARSRKPVEFQEQLLSPHNEDVVKRELYRLHKRRAKLHLN